MTSRQIFIQKVAAPAQQACKGTGLFPSLMIAQAILESGEGKSGLSASYNNYFGIKAGGGWTGKTVTLPTREVLNGKSVTVQAAFRAYNSLLDGFKDRCKFLRDNPRYAKAGVFTAATPEAQAEAFQKAGYATDPQYAKLLCQIINGSGNLKQYDKI